MTKNISRLKDTMTWANHSIILLISLHNGQTLAYKLSTDLGFICINETHMTTNIKRQA